MVHFYFSLIFHCFHQPGKQISIIDNLKSQIEIQNKTITYLEQNKQLIKKKINMGATRDTSNDPEASSSKRLNDEETVKVTNLITRAIVW